MTGPRNSVESPKRITLKRLAEHLGLSRTTVSVVLNDSPLARTIALKTRERIIQAAKQFNYKPNYFARYLNEGRSYLIGVLSPDLAEGYDAGVLSGIEEFLLESQYHFFVASHQWSEDRVRKTSEIFLERGVEGMILINTEYGSDIDLPQVNIGTRRARVRGTCVSIDNAVGVREALNHLYALGHSEIAVVKGHKDSADTEVRLRAVREGARELGMKIHPELVVQLERLGSQQNSGIEEGVRCAERLLATGRKFTAVVAFNDTSAMGVIKKLHEIGKSVPGDVSVVGFDDIPAAQVTYPTLTTLRQPLREMGATAARELIAMLAEGERSNDIVLKPELIVRSSTGRVNAGSERTR
jgi:DNA-binding LacI/PurR family transcriptional regulator